MENREINTHNNNYWYNTKPYYMQEMHHKNSVSVCCGIWNELIGPVFYEGTLTATKCIELILNGTIIDILEVTSLY